MDFLAGTNLQQTFERPSQLSQWVLTYGNTFRQLSWFSQWVPIYNKTFRCPSWFSQRVPTYNKPSGDAVGSPIGYPNL
eukprot:4553350-Ditylum_brightwellii.AAC.1